MSFIIVANSLSVSLQVFKDRSTIEEEIRVWLSHLALCLRICSKRQVELLDVLVIDEKVREMRISKYIYTRRFVMI